MKPIIPCLLLSFCTGAFAAEIITLEAEKFSAQTRAEKRAWHIFSLEKQPGVTPDGDPPHLEGASGGSYIELLPDTRRSDHAAFWHHGYPAVMLTDTADFRNPHYHRPTDTLETLNLAFMEQVARAVTAAAIALCSTTQSASP